jgi:glycosyltransferase involved in cell wall biosynthesis
MVKVSVLINTLNEEKNIKNCLESVKWANEIIIVDMHSDDKTVEIARDYTSHIYMHERVGYADPARQFALDRATNEWILFVDADELIPVELKNALVQLAESGKYDAIQTPHRNYFFGHEMRGTGWGPLQDMHIRFFKKSMMKYTEQIHGFAQLSPNARVYSIKDPNIGFIHFNYKDVEHFLEKLNRYTTIEAKTYLASQDNPSILRVFYRVLKEFFYRYIKQKGYKDGFIGFALAFLMCGYRMSIALKHYLMKQYNTDMVRKNVENQYDDISGMIARDYLVSENTHKTGNE